MSKFIGILSSSVVGAGLLAGLAQAEEINIATVNNGDMIIMQKLSSAWRRKQATRSTGSCWKRMFCANA